MQRGRHHPSLRRVPDAAVDAVARTLREDGQPVSQTAGGMTYLQARAANEVLKAQERKIKVEALRGTLIDRAKACAAVFKMARQGRNSWQNWPLRVSALMAAELGVENTRCTPFLFARCASSCKSCPKWTSQASSADTGHGLAICAGREECQDFRAEAITMRFEGEIVWHDGTAGYPDALVDQLLGGADAKTAFDEDGLLDQLKKALAERALNAEMDHHLDAGEGCGKRHDRRLWTTLPRCPQARPHPKPRPIC